MVLHTHIRNTMTSFFSLRISLILAFAIFVPPCSAQPPQLDAFAARIVEELDKTHEKTVIVFAFVGPDKKSSVLGQKVSDDFRDALTKSSAGVTVIDRSQIAQALETNRLSPQNLREPELELWLAKKLSAGLMVLGTFKRDEENLNISVNSYHVVNGMGLKGFKITVPMTEHLKLLLDSPIDVSQDELAGVPTATTTNGYSFPICIYCPPAPFSPAAIKNLTAGSVILAVVVGTDGRAHNILVVKMQPDGLAESAIETVQSWRFKPATSPDGAPTAVKQTIEIVFHRGF
jgi:TonB family protein